MSATVASCEQLLDGYASCEALTRAAAANFYYGIRLLGAEKRRAMCAVYAFARTVDDIGDGDDSVERKLELLAATRASLQGLSGAPTPISLALQDAQRRFALPQDALEDLIAGVEMDVLGRRYQTFAQLLDYCRHVAGTVGRLCVAIFGSSDPERAERLAEDLGVAMQLTNILRDVREDFERGRVYLPGEDLERFGCPQPLEAPAADFARLVAFEAARAERWFARGLPLLDVIDARSGACVAAMCGIYRRILVRIRQRPALVREGRIALPSWEKGWVALRSLAGARP
jgi:phytoene synthase